MNRVEAIELLGQLSKHIEAWKVEAQEAGDALILSGPRHYCHPLSELNPVAADVLGLIQERAEELLDLQRAYLPNEFWLEYGNLDLDESDPVPVVRVLLAHRVQPVVCCALCAVGRGLSIDGERAHLLGGLSLMVSTMMRYLEDSSGDVGQQSPKGLRRVASVRSELPPNARWVLRHLMVRPATIKQLRLSEAAPSLGTLKRWLPRLEKQHLVVAKREGVGKEWSLTQFGRAVVDDVVA